MTKKIISLFLCMLLSLPIFSINVFATSTDISLNNKPAETLATITTSETGETITLLPKESKITTSNNKSMPRQKTFEATFEIPNNISTFDYNSGSKYSNFITVKGTIYYDTKGDKIKVTKATGSWKGKFSYMYFTKRKIYIHRGDGKVLKKAPTKNSFSYKTGWGYVINRPSTDVSGPRLIMDATAMMSGMTAKYFITLTFNAG